MIRLLFVLLLVFLAELALANPLCRWAHGEPVLLEQVRFKTEASGNEKIQKIYDEVFDSEFRTGRWTQRKLTRLVGKLYGKLYDHPSLIKKALSSDDFISQKISDWQMEKIAYQTTRTAFTEGILKAFTEAGLVRTPTLRDRLSQFLSDHQNWIRSSLATAISIATTLTHQLPIYMPEYRLVLAKLRAHPELLDRIFLEGFLPHQAEVEELLGPRMKTEFGLNAVFRTVSSLVLIASLMQISHEKDLRQEQMGNSILQAVAEMAKEKSSEERAWAMLEADIAVYKSKGQEVDPNSPKMQARLREYQELYAKVMSEPVIEN